MSLFESIHPSAAFGAVQRDALVRRVVVKRLDRVLSFTRLTIDDVISNPIARNVVRGYWKLSKQVDRSSEISELERQWNPNGLS